MNQQNEQLIDDYLNGRMDPEKFQLLEQRLIQDKDFAKLYADMTRFDSHLGEIFLDDVDQKKWIRDLKKNDVPSQPNTAYWKIAAQVFLAIGFVALLLTINTDQRKVVITKMIGAHFNTLNLKPGPIKYDQTYQIKEGFMSLNFGKQTEVIIEAPAKFKSSHSNNLWVDYGKVSVNIPKGSEVFEIQTKNGLVKEVNASYAMDVTEQHSELHVFEGQVQLKNKLNSKALTVNQGQAAIRQGNQTKYKAFRNAWFVHSKEFHQLAKGWSVDKRNAWFSSNVTWEQNPHLLASYRIEKDKAQFHDPEVVQGAKWVQGRWPGTWALDFSDENDHVKIQAKGKSDQFTLMAWVRLDHQPRIYNSIYHTHDWERNGQVHWMVIEGQYMLLGIFGNSVLDKDSLRKPFRDQPESNMISNPFGRWVHLATTYDKNKKLTRFFIDGKCVNEAKYEIAHTAVFDSGQIGNWNLRKWGGSRQLSGRLDEFMIYTTVLTDHQIEYHYTAGTPYIN
jgi:hypothetical protein